MGASASTVEKGDEALRFVGTVELWKNIVVSTLVAVGTVVGIVALVRYHSDWTHGRFKVSEATCDPPHSQTTCHNDRCTTKQAVSCPKLHVDGFSQAFAADYVQPAKPPTVGSEVKVFFDPKDKSQAFLAHNDFVDEYKSWIIAGLVLLLLGAASSAWFQYYVRGSHMAQRVAGGAAVFDMATGRGL